MIYLLKHFWKLYFFLPIVIPAFTTIFSCTEEEIDLPDGWENIPGVYVGELYKVNFSPPHDQIDIRSINATVTRIDDYYSIEFEENNLIQIPILNLEVIGTRYHSIYLGMKETQGYSINDEYIDNNHFKLVIDSPLYPDPEIRIRLNLINGDYHISFNGIRYL